MNVEFYSGKAYLIDSKELKEKVFLECESILGCKLKRDQFPGAQPVAIERKDLNLKEKYMVCEKSDGLRAVLMTIYLNKKPMCFMINRLNEIYFTEFSFKKEVYEGSIFDGEIIQTKSGSWNYLIHDCMAYNGVSFMNKSHRLRYACGIDLIVKRYNHKDTDCLSIKTKIFYVYGPGIAKTWEHIKNTTENKIDGLILTPVDHPIQFGRDYKLLKWKETNTIDFLVKIVSKKINLYYFKKALGIYKSFKPDQDNYKRVIEFVKDNENVDLVKGVIIEFEISKDLETFTCYRIRTDKSAPNGEITVENTLKNIEEAITVKELFT
jgi:mRNA guanylyltransferase